MAATASWCSDIPHLHSFPTRRSSDLVLDQDDLRAAPRREAGGEREGQTLDRKSTRLNSSHPSSSYAVFCLKKKPRTPGRCGSVCTRGPATTRGPASTRSTRRKPDRKS